MHGSSSSSTDNGPHVSGEGATCKPTVRPAPGLYLVATPIGNLRDITLRAIDVLQSADIILCEDTRVSRTLLDVYGIKGKTLSCHEHNQLERAPEVCAAIAAGKVVALISDAGMPLISDPGAPLLAAVRAQNLPFTVIPGANAVLPALCLSGLPGERFFFAGFLPTKTGERRQALAELATIPATLVFYESPNRLTDFLQDALTLYGNRPAAVVRELTKLHEEARASTLDELLAHYTATPPRGEIVALVGPPAPQANWDESQIDAALAELLTSTSTRDAAAQVSARSGWAKREVYARALALTQKERGA